MKLVHDGHQKEHLGHQWRTTGSSTLFEDIKILWWILQKKIEKLISTKNK